MKELHDIAASLINADGSCRDINFEAPTWEGVEDLMANLIGSYGNASATDGEGRTVATLPNALLETARDIGSVHLILREGSGLIKFLQVFVFSEEDGAPFVELTFFPDDVERTPTLRGDFIEWANTMRARLGARRYYARYEDVSWQFGDTGANSGVFLVSDEADANI